MPTITGINPFNAKNYVGSWSPFNNQFTTANRIDYKLGDKDSFYGRFSIGHYNQRSQFYGVPSMDWTKAPGNTQGTIAPNWNFAGSWVHTFSPTFFNEFVISGTRTKQDTLTGDGTTVYDTLLGLPNPFNSVQWPGLYDVAFNSYLYETQNGTSFYAFYGIIDDNATKIVGKHELQFGFHYRADRMNLLPQQQQTGGSDSWASTARRSTTRPPRARTRLHAVHRRPVRELLHRGGAVQQPVEPRDVLRAGEGIRGLPPGQLAGHPAADPEPGVAL